jgi:hypothetical protein
MNPNLQKQLLRLLGVGVFAVGALVGKVGLDEHDRRMGGPDSPWTETEATIERIEPDPRYEDRRRQVYAFTAPNGAEMECPVNRRPEIAAPVGETVTIWAHSDNAPGNCRIATENWDAGFTPAHFMMLFAAAWMAMGAAFVIRPPKNISVGGGGGPI